MQFTGRSRAALIAIGGAFLGASVAVVATGLPHRPQAAASRGQAPIVKAAPAQYNPTPAAVAAAAPVGLQIPRLGVQARVERVDPTPALMIGVPRNTSEVAWYDLGPAPGQAGDAVLVGHLDSETGGPAVFQNLSLLARGDAVVALLADGSAVRFRVTRAFWTPFTSIPDGLLAVDGPARMSLITCAGAWDAGKKTYSQRLVVQATAIQ